MMTLIPELFFPGCFTLLTAPVAAGKTKLVVDYYDQQRIKIVYLSPLRALANEVYENLKRNQSQKLYPDKNIFLAGGDEPLMQIFEKFLHKKKAFMVCTMELLDEDFLEACYQASIKESSTQILFVIDEFHLFYYWGEQFRPILHDRFLAILNYHFPVLAMTATLSDLVMHALKKDLSYYQDFWIHLDSGNQKLHREPREIISFYGLRPRFIKKAFWRELRKKKKGEVFLFFCAYRTEVDEWVQCTSRQGFQTLGCVGGEVEDFLKKLSETPQLDCIFATTTLSHGVNLPEIKKVFIDYEVKNYDFWLQMIGRGGRKGSQYEVYSIDKFHTSQRDRVKQRAKVLFFDLTGIDTF